MTAISGIRGFLSVIFLVIDVINAGPLSAAENEQRQNNCGEFNIPTPATGPRGEVFDYTNTSKESWLLTIHPKNSVRFPITTAFLISARHILTSAQVLLSDNNTWRVNGKSFEKNCSANGGNVGYSDVAIDALKTLEVWDSIKPLRIEILKARLFCVYNTYDCEFYVPLLLEIPTTSGNVLCFADEENSNIKVGDVVHSYGIGADGRMKHHKIKITSNVGPTWLQTEKYCEGGNDRGGPAVSLHNGKATVIGLKEFDPPRNSSEPLYFYSTAAFEKEVCEFSGVCGRYPTTNYEQNVVWNESAYLDRVMEKLGGGSYNVYVSAEFNHTNTRKLLLLEIAIVFLFLFEITWIY